MPRPTLSTILARAVLGGALLAAPACTAEDESAGRDAPPAASAPPPAAPAEEVPPALAAFAPLVGRTVAEAEQWLQEHPTPSPDHPGTNVTVVRPIEIDGVTQMVTMDLRGDRLNVVVNGGKITGLDRIG